MPAIRQHLRSLFGDLPASEPAAVFSRPSVIALLTANLFPLVGVLFMGWTVGMVMLLFWLENVVVGVFNILRMMTATKDGLGNHLSKVFLIPFFTVHYGIFTAVHGMFVIVLFVAGPDGGAGVEMSPVGMLPVIAQTVQESGLYWAVAALFVSHGVSFVANFIGRGEYQRITAQELMGKPYARVVVLHVVIIFGAMLVAATGQMAAALVLLVLVKIGVDLGAHLHERKRLATQQILDELKAKAQGG